MAQCAFRFCDLSGVADWLRGGKPLTAAGVGIPVAAGDVARCDEDTGSDTLFTSGPENMQDSRA